jgi:signal transduction histidine kinase
VTAPAHVAKLQVARSALGRGERPARALISLREVAVIGVVFTAIALMMSAGLPMEGYYGGYWGRAMHLVPYYWIWSALSVGVVAIARRLRDYAVHPIVQLGVHVLLAAVVIAVQIALYVMIVDTMLDSIVMRFSSEPFSVRVGNAFVRHLLSNVLTYALLVGGILAFDQYQRTRDALAQARLETLRNQLHPHFLFNALQGASSLMHRDKAAAEEMLERLGDFLRVVLRRDDRHLLTLREELELLDHYLAVMRLRFGDRLQVTVNVDTGLESALVPVLLLQPLVENALQHGVDKRTGSGNVQVRVRRHGDRLELSVEDDGPGIDENALSERVGLTNTRARLKELFSDHHSVALLRAAERGTRVVVSIPLTMTA